MTDMGMHLTLMMLHEQVMLSPAEPCRIVVLVIKRVGKQRQSLGVPPSFSEPANKDDL